MQSEWGGSETYQDQAQGQFSGKFTQGIGQAEEVHNPTRLFGHEYELPLIESRMYVWPERKHRQPRGHPKVPDSGYNALLIKENGRGWLEGLFTRD